MKKDIRTMTLTERYKYINEQKRKKFNTITQKKNERKRNCFFNGYNK
jgi:ribosomal protein L29